MMLVGLRELLCNGAIRCISWGQKCLVIQTSLYGLRESLCLGFGSVCGKLEMDRSRYCGNEVGYDSDIDR